MFKEVKVGNEIHLHDENTGDPVAIMGESKDRWGEKFHTVDWHPVMRQLYPEIDSNFSLQFGGYRTAKSKIRAKEQAEHMYDILLGSKVKDRIPTKYVGDHINPVNKSFDTQTVEKQYEAYHPETGEHIANLFVNPQTETARTSFVGVQPTPEQMKVISKYKTKEDPLNHLDMIHRWSEIRGQQPRFVGIKSRAGHSVYKTHLDPESASKAYEEHIKKIHSSLPINRVSPTVFMAGDPNKAYSTYHIVDASRPGELHHISTAVASDYDTTNNAIM